MDFGLEDTGISIDDLSFGSESSETQSLTESMSSSIELFSEYPDPNPEGNEENPSALTNPSPANITPDIAELWYEPSVGLIVVPTGFEGLPNRPFDKPGLSRLAVAAIETATDQRNNREDAVKASKINTDASEATALVVGGSGDALANNSSSDEDTEYDSDSEEEGEDGEGTYSSEDSDASDEIGVVMAISLQNNQMRHPPLGQTRRAEYYASSIGRVNQPSFLKSRVYKRSPLARELKLVSVCTPSNAAMELLVWQVHTGNGVQGDNHPRDSFEGKGRRYCESCQGDCTWAGMMPNKVRGGTIL